MAWKYRYPLPEEYDTLEDYEEACKLYEWAESQYVDECVENYYEEKYLFTKDYKSKKVYKNKKV